MTPVLATPDACHLITPAFAIAVRDSTATDEHAATLFQPISLELVAAALNAGFTTLWTPMATPARETPAIALQAAQRAAEAAAALTHALRGDPAADPVAVLPMLARIVNAAAGPLVELCAESSEHGPDVEQTAALAVNVLRLVAQQIEHLGQTGAPPADSWPPA